MSAVRIRQDSIGKGKADAPYEFGCKVSIATPATKSKGGQFVLHAKEVSFGANCDIAVVRK